MFRKIVSNLSFSPALVGQLGFYAKRLRQEEATRKLGLIFVVLALVVQSLAVFQAPESANATSPNDFVYGGLHSSINNFLQPYDTNTTNLKDIMTYTGITREEIASAKYGSFTTGNKLSWGHNSYFSTAQGEHAVPITNTDGSVVTTVYARPISLYYGTKYKIYGWIGHSAKVGWFALMQACGNLVTDSVPAPPAPPTPPPATPPVVTPKSTPPPTPPATPPIVTPKSTPPPTPPAKCALNPSLLADSKDCQPCPGNANLWIKDETCVANITQTKTAVNVSQGSVDASTVTAKASDVITYTISIKNTGLATKTVKMEDSLSDVLEYSTLIDNGGGSFDKTTKLLSWPDVTLAPNESQTRSFVIRVLDVVPDTAQGLSNPTSFDCHMTNVFGNTVNIAVSCNAPKVVEQIATQLPKTGPSENLLFAGIVLGITTYFYTRTRQVKKEVRLIRRNLSTGTI